MFEECPTIARPLRLEYLAAVYHVRSRGNARQDIVLDDRDRALFLEKPAHVIDRFGWHCHAYCPMDNHYHLLLETPRPTVSRGMRQLNGTYPQAVNRRHQRVGHLFQGRFTAILVETEAHLLELCRDVVLNLVRAQAVSYPRHWAWSRYRATAGEGLGLVWLTTDWILAHCGRTVREVQEHYRQCVAAGRAGPQPWSQLKRQIYLGSEAFIARHQPNRVLRDIPRRQTQAARPTLKALFQRRGNEAHRIAVAYRQYGYRLREIAERLGVHEVTVSRRLKRRTGACLNGRPDPIRQRFFLFEPVFLP